MSPAGLDHVWADILVKYIVPTTKHSTYGERFCIRYLKSRKDLLFGRDYQNQVEVGKTTHDTEGRKLHGFVLVGVYNIKSEMNKGKVVFNADIGRDDYGNKKLKELRRNLLQVKMNGASM